MGQIGRFIDRCVEREPDLMRRVLDRPWGTLARFVDFDSEGEACGCLVGSVGIEAGAELYGIDTCDDSQSAISSAADAAGVGLEHAALVGLLVWDRLCRRLAGQTYSYRIECKPILGRSHAELLTIAMLKNRIARRLREQGIETRRPEVLMVRQTVGA